MVKRFRLLGVVFILIGLSQFVVFRDSALGLTGGLVFALIGVIFFLRAARRPVP